jgi:serine protease Do
MKDLNKYFGVALLFLLPPASAWARGERPANDLELLRATERGMVKLVDQLSPQVVAITAWREAVPPENSGKGKSGENTPLLLPVRGSGCVLSEDGEILTNEHVIRRTKRIQVMLFDGREFEARLTGSDCRSDLAVLKIKAGKLSKIRLNPLVTPQRGQWVLAMGNPLGMAFDGQSAVSLGIISSLGRHVPDIDRHFDRYYGNLILTTAQISNGNSGGPLFNLAGEVIGINAIVSFGENGGSLLSFAIPLDEWALRIINHLRKGEEVEYGYVGISLTSQSGKPGPIVAGILEDTPAARADIRPNDVIVAYNGKKINSVDQLILLIGQTIPGKIVGLRMVRDGRTFDVSLTAARRRDFVHKDQ